MANDFVHLNVHTEYSLLNNYNPIEKLIEKAKELNFKAMAITICMVLSIFIKDVKKIL